MCFRYLHVGTVGGRGRVERNRGDPLVTHGLSLSLFLSWSLSLSHLGWTFKPILFNNSISKQAGAWLTTTCVLWGRPFLMTKKLSPWLNNIFWEICNNNFLSESMACVKKCSIDVPLCWWPWKHALLQRTKSRSLSKDCIFQFFSLSFSDFLLCIPTRLHFYDGIMNAWYEIPSTLLCDLNWKILMEWILMQSGSICSEYAIWVLGELCWRREGPLSAFLMYSFAEPW